MRVNKMDMDKSVLFIPFHIFPDDLIINENTAAVLADYDFLARTDIELSLRRYLVETSAAGIPLDRNDREAISCI